MVLKLRTVMGVEVGGFGIRGPRNKKVTAFISQQQTDLMFR